MGHNHYEGRNWLGFHHHGVLCMAACSFLVAERARLYPQNLLLSSSPLGYPEVSVRGGVPVLLTDTWTHQSRRYEYIRLAICRTSLPCCPCCGVRSDQAIL
jgi:hypothetical protein